METVKKTFLGLVLWTSLIGSAGAQTTDSLQRVLVGLEGQDRIDVLHQLIISVWLNYPEQAMDYGEEAWTLSRRSGDSTNISKSLRFIAGVHYYKGDYESSLLFNQRALAIALQIGDSSLINNGYNNIGLLYYDLGSYQPALEYLLKALEIKRRIGEKYGMATNLNNVGLVFEKVANYEKARDYFTEAYDLEKKSNTSDLLVYSLNNIGRTHLHQGDIEKARKYFDQASTIAQRIDNINWGSVSLRSIGEVEQSRGEYDSADFYFQKSLKASESIEDKKGIYEAYYLLAKLALKIGNSDQAIEYLNSSNEMAAQLKARQQLLDNLKLFTTIYKAEGNQGQVIHFQARYITLRDSLFLDVINRNLSLIPIKLKEEGDRLKLSKQQTEIVRKNLTNTIITLILIAFVPLLVFLIVLLRKNRKKNHELRENNEKLKSTQKLLIRSEKMASLGVLASGIGHEINNPLNFIKNGVVALSQFVEKSENDEAELKPFIDIINEGVSRSTSIVNSLSHFSHTSASMVEECDLHAIIDNCLLILNPKLEGNIEIVKGFTKKSVLVVGNAGKLHQSMLNILSNAQQAMERGGTLTVTTGARNDKVIIAIKDTGTGILEENLLKISDPFFTTKAPGSGIGLGLFITYSIIEEHGGEVHVTSNPNKGTEFIVTLDAQK